MSAGGGSKRRRASKRRLTRAVLEARASGRTCPVQLHDVSVTGCKIDSAALDLSRDDKIALKFADEITVRGKIAWRRGDAAGVQFTGPLPDTIARHLRP